VAQFQEERKAEQSVDFLALGTMMWEQQAIEFWQSTPGGSLSRSDAQARWNYQAANYEALGIVNDQLSPNKEKPLRLRVHTGDDVNFGNRSVHSNGVVMSEAGIKKPKEADIEKMAGRIMTGFSSGSGAANFESQQIAQAMVSAGAGMAFNDIGVRLDDITVLGKSLVKQTDDDEENEDDEQGDAGGGDGVPAPSPKKDEQKGQKRKWLDISKEINSTRRGLRAQLASLTKNFEEVEGNIQRGIATIQALPLQTQKLCQGELALAKTRLVAVQSVLGREGTDLTQFIRSFEVVAATPDESLKGADTASQVAVRKIAKAPPCCNYTELEQLSVLAAIIDKVDTSSSPEELKTAASVRMFAHCPRHLCSMSCALR
jgi:hypothetical protein